MKRMKICLISSSGGHWEELMCIKDIIYGRDYFFITEEGGQAEACGVENVYALPQMNRRERFFVIKFVKLVLSAIKILNAEKPEVVVTTGALISVPFCFVAKMMGAKVVFVESFSRVYNKSLSGRLVYPIADLFLVQWETLMELYPKAKYIGGVF